jgi:predicted permease
MAKSAINDLQFHLFVPLVVFNTCRKKHFEQQNVEQGISNNKVITSLFCGFLFCCSTCPPSASAQARRAGIRFAFFSASPCLRLAVSPLLPAIAILLA